MKGNSLGSWIIMAIIVTCGIDDALGRDHATERSRERTPRMRTQLIHGACGNGILNAGERCDTGRASGSAGACPSSCNDSDSCTQDLLIGAGTCRASCMHFDWCSDAPKSDYFKDDTMAEAILAGEREYDLEREFPVSSGYDLGAMSDQWGAKLLNGIKQVGYLNHLTSSAVGQRIAEVMLNTIQRNNGLPLSTKVDRAVLTRIDEMVLAAEQRVASLDVANRFVCYSVMRNAPPLNSSKEHVASLLLLATESYPEELRLKSEECFDPQIGWSHNYEVIWHSATWREVAADGSLREPYVIHTLVSVDDYTVVAMTVHEFAHILDGDHYNYQRPGGAPRIDTSEFINISYDYSSRQRDGWVYYLPRLDMNDPDAVRQHFFSYGTGWTPDNLPGYYTAAEDFATCVSMYILHGAVFRDYASTRPPLAAKYAWIRDHVFSGVEFATGDPGYAAYAPDLTNLGWGIVDVTGLQELRVLVDPEYVWDYSIPTLMQMSSSVKKDRRIYRELRKD